jgi:hypothetical protein
MKRQKHGGESLALSLVLVSQNSKQDLMGRFGDPEMVVIIAANRVLSLVESSQYEWLLHCWLLGLTVRGRTDTPPRKPEA